MGKRKVNNNILTITFWFNSNIKNIYIYILNYRKRKTFSEYQTYAEIRNEKLQKLQRLTGEIY